MGDAGRAVRNGAPTDAADTSHGIRPGPVHPVNPPGRFALGMALTPMARLVVGVPLALSGGGSGAALAIAARLVASLALAAADRRALSCTGYSAPGIMWALVPEGYLWVRARRLGRKPGWFWLALGCEAVAYVAGTILVAVILGRAPTAQTSTAEPDAVLPYCADHSVIDDVLATFGDIPEAKAAGLRGIMLTGQSEVAQGPGAVPRERVCDGVIEASDTGRYDVSYGFEIIQGRLIVRVALR